MVNVKILNQYHTINCEKDQEEHLHFLVEKLENRMRSISSNPNIPTYNLLLMAALTMEDELHNSDNKLADSLQENPASPSLEIHNNFDVQSLIDEVNDISNFLENLAIKIENL